MDMSNKREFIFHIGPPKTATTSLQNFFIENSFEGVKYEGIIQPRKNDNGSLCKKIYKNVSNSQVEDIEELSLGDFENSKSYFFSEEMFLFDSRELSWQKKMQRLYALTSQLDPRILIVIRNPIDAIRSYYQEVYYSLDKVKITSINDFALSNYCAIYHYEELFKFLNDIGFKDFIALDFNKLVGNKYTGKDLFKLSSDFYLEIGKSNKSKISDSQYYANNTKLTNVIADTIPARVKNIVPHNLRKKVISFIPSVKINKAKKLEVEIDDSIKKAFLKPYFKITNQKF